MKIREVIIYKNYFEDFFKEQTRKVQDKIIKVLDIIEQIERIPGILKEQMVCLKSECNLVQTFLESFVSLMVKSLLFYSPAFKRKRKKLLPEKLNAL